MADRILSEMLGLEKRYGIVLLNGLQKQPY